MKTRESTTPEPDKSLPRPVVLRPEDLASIAAAGGALNALVGPNVIRAGGIPAGPSLLS